VKVITQHPDRILETLYPKIRVYETTKPMNFKNIKCLFQLLRLIASFICGLITKIQGNVVGLYFGNLD
jgi:hypothetical protein